MIKNKSISLFNQIKGDYCEFTTLEQAEILNNINTEFSKKLEYAWVKTCAEQKKISTAKNLIK